MQLDESIVDIMAIAPLEFGGTHHGAIGAAVIKDSKDIDDASMLVVVERVDTDRFIRRAMITLNPDLSISGLKVEYV